jgi:peptide/nickel transport system substrate-binding protein
MNRLPRSVRWYLALPLAVALVLSACGGQTATTSPEPTNDGTDGESPAAIDSPDQAPEATTVRAAVTGDEGTLNPYTYVTGFPGWNLLMMQYDGLMQIDVDGVPQNWLASDIQVNEDGTVYTVALVDGVTWHDGEALTADDVVFTYQYFPTNPAASRFARDLNGVESVEAVDELTVEITLAAPNPSFPLQALADVPIIPEHIWADVTTPEEHQFDGPNVGSGPYQITDYSPNQSYTLEANPDYFRGAPAADEVILVVFADDAGALAAMNSGEVDVIFGQVAPEQIELLGAREGVEVLQGPEFTNQLLYYDTQLPPFDDVAVRQAMSLAIDRQDLVDTVFLGAATVGNAGWTHPMSAVYNDAVTTEYDAGAANDLLDDAGYTDSDDDGIREYDGQPMSFELLTPSGDSLRLRSAELLSTMLAEIGIQANVSSVEQATWEEAVWPGFDVNQGRNYQLAMWGWSAPTQADPGRTGALIHSDPALGSLNLTGFSNPDADDLANRLATEGDPDERQAILDELQVLFAEELPFITILYPDGAYAFNADVYDGWVFVTGQGIVSKLSLLTPDARP